MSLELPHRPSKANALNLYNVGAFSEAKDMCQILCQKSQEDPEIWCLLCAINGSMELLDEALSCGQKSVSLDPDYTLARFNLANVLLRLDMVDDAISELREVLNKWSDHGLAYFLLGACYNKRAGKVREVLDCYEKAIALLDNPPNDLIAGLAELYEQVGDSSQARSLADTLLQVNADDPRAELILARLDKGDNQLESARTRLQKLLQASISPHYRLVAQSLLAHILDRLGEYEVAFDEFSRTQNLSAKIALKNYKPGFWYDRIHRNRAVCQKEIVLRWREHSLQDGLPAPVFLVGFPRSGTTLTERVISTHPGVISSDEYGLIHGVICKLGEITKNGSMGYPYSLNELTEEQVSVLRREYWNLAQQQCGAMPGVKLFLDKLPLNIIEILLINRIFPEAKILLLLRDPRDVCLSCFMQLFHLNDAMENFVDLESSARFYDATMSLWLHYEEALDLRLLKLRYEDLITDFELHSREILTFIDLPWDDRILSYYKDKTHGISTPSYQDTSKPIYSRAVGRWMNYRKQMQVVLPILEPYIKTFGYEHE